MSKWHLTACLCALVITAGSVSAQTRYISDQLTVPLRSGPSNQHRILHRGLPSGTQMEVLQEDEASGFTQIRTTRGTEGWVRTQYLVSEPIARDRLSAAQRAVSEANARSRSSAGQLQESQQRIRNLSSQNTELNAELERTQAELAEIKRISASAISDYANNQRLTGLNATLRDELEDIVAARDRLEENLQRQWLLMGAGLLLIGLVIGFVIKARPRRSAWS